MAIFELYLSAIDAKRFKAIVTQSPVGEGETESSLPFLDGEIDWRMTLIKTVETATGFNPKNFQKATEQDWMTKSGILSEDRSAFHPNFLKNIGRALYQSLFPPGSKAEKVLQEALRLSEHQNTQLRIQLKFEADVVQRSRLADYPWELLHDGQRFLAHHQVTISRYIAQESVPPNLPAVEQVNVLLVSSAAYDLEQGLKPLTKKEQQAVREGLQRASEAGDICLAELEYATVNALRSHLTEHRGKDAPHVLHFDGHGLFGKRCSNPQCRTIHQGIKTQQCQKCNMGLPDPQGFLVFEDEEGGPDYVSAEELGTLLRQSSFGDRSHQQDLRTIYGTSSISALANISGAPLSKGGWGDLCVSPNQPGGVALMVLSACQSAMAVAGDSVFNGTAQNLIGHRVPAVVAMQYSVSVQAATQFAEQFYRSLGQKNSLAVAVSQGREAMGVEGNQWYRPVLYLRWRDNEGGQLFAARSTPATSAARLAVPFQAPPLPAYFVDRPEVSQDLKNRLLTGSSSKTRTLVISAIHGLGAIGKSTLAAALAHDEAVKKHFYDGILWATLGQQPDVLSVLGSWVQALGDRDFRATSLEATTIHLRTLLSDKAALLVVDDAWNSADTQPFKVGGPRCKMLVTTREAAIADALGANTYPLDVMKPEQAMELLTKKLKELGRDLQDTERQLAADLAKAVGYLPLALELAAAQVGDGISWTVLLQDLKQEVARLKTFDRPGAREVCDEASLKRLSLTASLNLSVQRLSDERQNFIWLGVLPEDASITQAMAATLWEMDERDAADTLQYLRSKALLLPGVSRDDGTRTYRLHDLLHDLARHLLTAPQTPRRRGDLSGLGLTLAHAHATFVGKYRQLTENGLWHTLPKDGYVQEHLVWHLEQANQVEEIHNLLSEESKTGRNGWYEVRDSLAQTAGYLINISRAWELAEANPTEATLPKIVGLQCRYALMTTSVNSLAANLPVGLLVALLRSMWKIP